MLVGFGTRHILDRIIKPFVKKENGIFYDATFHNNLPVNPFEKTTWVDFNFDRWIVDKPDTVVFGILRGTEHLLWTCKDIGINYYYFDHSYFFKAHSHQPNHITKLRSYRITKNNENFNKIIELDKWDKNRIQKFYRLHTESLRLKNIPRGDKILIIPPTEAVCRYYKIHSLKQWKRQVQEKVRQYSDREFIIRPKTETRPLEEDLQNSHCVITFQSTAGITAILKGVPVICDDVSMCKSVSIKYEDIEKEYIRDDDLVNKWIDSLLANQFTIDEIKDGRAKKLIDKYDNYTQIR